MNGVLLSYWRLKDVKSLKGYSRTIALTIQRERERDRASVSAGLALKGWTTG